MSRQVYRLAVTFLLGALLVSACAPASPAAPTVTPAQASLTKTPRPTATITSTPLPPIKISPAALKGLTLQIWHAFAGPAAEVFTRQVTQFNGSNEWGIQVVPTGYGDYTSLFDAVGSALDAGQSPDLVASLPEQTLTWTAADAVVDLAPYLADRTWGMNAETIADIPSIFLAQDNVGGKQLGFPAQRSARFLFYNKTWAAELGFDNPPATSDEFRRQACAANAPFTKDSDPRNDSSGGWIIDTSWQSSYSWLLAFDGAVADGSSYSFRMDPNLATLKFIKGLRDSHCAWLPLEPASFDSFGAFARRLALFVSADLGEVPQAAASMAAMKNADQWELIPFPGPQKRVLVDYGPSYSVLKSTPERQLAAWVFIRWMLSSENQAEWVKSTGLFPLRTSVLDLVGPFRAASPQWDGAVKGLDSAENVPQLASWRKVRYVLEDGLTTIFQNDTPIAQLPSILTEMDTLAGELSK